MLHHTHAATEIGTQGRTIRWANRYDLTVQLLTLGQAGRMYSRIADRIEVQPGDKVLDVACGTGSLALILARRVGPAGAVAGIDAAPQMIAYARRKAARKGTRIDFRVEPVERLSFPDGTFDHVVSSLAFHHLPGDLKHQALHSMLRVLKPGGQLCIVDLLGGHTIPAHGRVQTGVQDLAVHLRAGGLAGVTSGPLRSGLLGLLPLGYVTARRASESGLDVRSQKPDS